MRSETTATTAPARTTRAIATNWVTRLLLVLLSWSSCHHHHDSNLAVGVIIVDAFPSPSLLPLRRRHLQTPSSATATAPSSSSSHHHYHERFENSKASTRSNSAPLRATTDDTNNNEDEEDEVFRLTPGRQWQEWSREIEHESKTKTKRQSPTTSTNNNPYYLDDLTPPPVNFVRNSILFSDNPSTKKRNNVVLDVWMACRTYLPAVLTGAWPWRDVGAMDDRPLAALYNMMLVRIPVIAVAVLYWKNLLWDDHGLVMDFGVVGDGPQVINPVVVTILVCVMLLP